MFKELKKGTEEPGGKNRQILKVKKCIKIKHNIKIKQFLKSYKVEYTELKREN